MEPKQQPPYPLRIAPDLRERLEKEAAIKKRSLNAEIADRLEQSLQSRDRDAVALVVSLASAEREVAMSELLLTAEVFSHAATAASLLELFLEAPEVCATVLGESDLEVARAEAEAAIKAAEERDKSIDVDTLTGRVKEADQRLADGRKALRRVAEQEAHARGMASSSRSEPSAEDETGSAERRAPVVRRKRAPRRLES